MNRFMRGILTGSVIGATVGLVMLVKKNQGINRNLKLETGKMNGRVRGTVRMVKDNASRWSSAVKSGTEAFSRKLANRTS